ncbi:hypothetical protein AtEden1_Chr4g0284981 [Arabidopsis thaliana]
MNADVWVLNLANKCVFSNREEAWENRTREDHDQLKLNRVYWRELLIQKMLITKTSFTLVRQ